MVTLQMITKYNLVVLIDSKHDFEIVMICKLVTISCYVTYSCIVIKGNLQWHCHDRFPTVALQWWVTYSGITMVGNMVGNVQWQYHGSTVALPW